MVNENKEENLEEYWNYKKSKPFIFQKDFFGFILILYPLDSPLVLTYRNSSFHLVSNFLDNILYGAYQRNRKWYLMVVSWHYIIIFFLCVSYFLCFQFAKKMLLLSEPKKWKYRVKAWKIPEIIMLMIPNAGIIKI